MCTGEFLFIFWKQDFNDFVELVKFKVPFFVLSRRLFSIRRFLLLLVLEIVELRLPLSSNGLEGLWILSTEACLDKDLLGLLLTDSGLSLSTLDFSFLSNCL